MPRIVRYGSLLTAILVLAGCSTSGTIGASGGTSGSTTGSVPDVGATTTDTQAAKVTVYFIVHAGGQNIVGTVTFADIVHGNPPVSKDIIGSAQALTELPPGSYRVTVNATFVSSGHGANCPQTVLDVPANGGNVYGSVDCT